MSEFGIVLLEYRKKSYDDQLRKPLTQHRLADLLTIELGFPLHDKTISVWERGKSQIDKDDRRTLVGLIKVLYQYRGISSLEEANRLLRAGNYRDLDQNEIQSISPNLSESSSNILGIPSVIASGEQRSTLSSPLSPQSSHVALRKAWFYLVDANIPENIETFKLDEPYWLANDKTKAGDLVIIYLTRPKEELTYIFRALIAPDADPDRSLLIPYYQWQYGIRLGHKITLSNPISIKDIAKIPELKDWQLPSTTQGSLQRQNDLTSEGYYQPLRNLILQKNPDIEQQLRALDSLPIANVDNIDGMIVRERPDTTSLEVISLRHRAEVFLLESELAFNLLGQQDGWIHIQTTNGLTGYLPAQYLRRPFTEHTTTAATSDQPFGVPDALDFGKYSRAFQELILNTQTQLPLTVGIYGTWGVGKSFLLNLIKEPFKNSENVHVVEFNAWEYHTHEIVWAGLVRKIIDQLECQIPLEDRVWNRTVRNIQRQSRNFDWKLIPYALIVFVLLISAVYTARGDFNQIIQILTGLGGIIGLFAFLQNILNTPVSQWIVNLFAKSEYGKAIGYMEDIKADINALRAYLLKDTKVLVLIDDLDRVPPDKIVDVLEAIKLLLDFPMFIVFLGLDARIVTRAVEERYKGILKDVGASGYEYLDKIVQIPFNIPRPSPSDIRQFLRKHFNPYVETHLMGRNTIPRQELTEFPPYSTSRSLPDTEENSTRSDIQPQTQVVASPLANIQNVEQWRIFQKAERRAVAFLAEEQKAFDAYADYLTPNPRHIKRLLNTYRLVRALAADEPDLLANPRYLIKWLILSMQWPFTIQRMLWGFQIGFNSPNMLNRLLSMEPEEQDESDKSPLLIKLYWYRMGNPNSHGDDALTLLPNTVLIKRNQLDSDNDLFLRMINNEVPEDAIDENILQKLHRYTTAFHPALDESVWDPIVADLELDRSKPSITPTKTAKTKN